MGIARSYALSNCKLTIGTVVVTGFGDDDAFSWQWSSALWNRKTGMDGDHVYARNVERVVQGRITLLGTSRAYATLTDLMEAQSGDQSGVIPSVLVPLPFLLVDTHTGDTITAKVCMFMSRPSPAKGQQLGNAVFGIELPNPKVAYGTLNRVQVGI